MNRITILLIFLIVISMVLPTSAIMYARGQTDDNSGSSSTGGGSTGNSGSTTTSSTQNNAALPTTSTASNNTGILQKLSAEDIKGLLDIHNRERAAVGSPPLVWNDAVAAHAQAWAKYLADGNPGPHCIYVPGWEKIESCTHHEGENVALRSPHNPTNIASMAEFWVSEKKNYHGGPYNDSVGPVIGHYTAMIWKSTTDVGCGFAYNNKTDFLSCRYIPTGNFNGQMPY
jgi:hypothetical protein